MPTKPSRLPNVVLTAFLCLKINKIRGKFLEKYLSIKKDN